ncbi:MAG TPA: type III pantothenate kinase, partial [Flavisolibacter sp.]|nr:type III pantothenate kinase [Flavisolibacter sp.]
MSTTLCLDFGNSRMKAALFADDKIKQFFILNEDPVQALHDILDEHQPVTAILSSVIAHDAELEFVLQARTRFHRLTHLSKLPFSIPVGKPETVGADRLAIAAAAVHLFPHQHTLVIALGTCITYNFINMHHQLMGGSISPGMDM